MRSNLCLIALLLILADTRTPDPHLWAAFNQEKSWLLEENEGGGNPVNLMTSGDYSGCTIVREIPAPGETTATGDRNRPAPGTILAVIAVR